MFKKLASVFQGRHTMFLCFFAITGTVMAWQHKLDANYVSLVVALQGAALTHSWKEDKFPVEKQD